MEQQQAIREHIHPLISRRFPLYAENPAFEAWLFRKAGSDAASIGEYLTLLDDYGYMGTDGSVMEGYDQMPEPARVMMDIEARIARLDQETLGMLRKASVEGERFSATVLAALDGSGPVEPALARAEQAGVIMRDHGRAEIPPLGGRYRFVPLRMHEVLYNDLTDAERAEYHTALVEHLGAELDRVEEPGAREMLAGLISEHNRRFTRPDPPPR